VVAVSLKNLRDRPPEPLAPSPQALGVWELAWPTIVASATQTLVRWADIKMVGSLGAEAVAGVSAGGVVYWFIQSVVMAVTTGLVAFVARSIGARNLRLADATLRQAIVLGSVFGVATHLAGLPLRFFAIEIYGVEPSVVQYGATYLAWLLAGNVPFTLTFVFAAALRAAGDSRTPLFVGIVANVLNVFLNWVLIYGKLGAPPLGVAGAGIASSLAMAFQVVVFAGLWGGRRLQLRPAGASFALDVALCRRILYVGYPAAIEGALWHVGLLLFMRIMSAYGTAEFVAYNIGAQILALSFLPGQGFAMAAATLVGQHLGDGQPERAARSGWRSLAGGVVALSINAVLIVALAGPIARWFIDDDEVVSLTADFILILGIAQPFMAVEFVMGGALRGAGDTRYPLGVLFTGLFLCRLIPATVAASVFHAPIQIVWSALLLDYATKALLLIVRFARGRWREIEI
jgi:putative MATE family efflux protein